MSLYDKEAEHTSFPFSPERFWQFSLKTYAKTGVKSACLKAQDDFGADVNLLLLCCWLGQSGFLPNQTLWLDLMATSDRWQQKLGLLRQSHRALVKGESAYDAALANEMAVEKDAQAAMIALLTSESLSAAGPSDALKRYAHHLKLPETIVSHLITATRPA